MSSTSEHEEFSESIFANFGKRRMLTPEINSSFLPPFQPEVNTEDLSYRHFQKIMPGKLKNNNKCST